MTATPPAPDLADDPTVSDARTPAEHIESIDLRPNLTAETFDVTRHDGRITIENTKTGGHRTFQIKTARGGKLAGKRIVSLLTGPCNEDFGDWTGFAFADEFGIKAWSRYRSLSPDSDPTDWERFADMLERPAHYVGRGLVYHIEGRCRRCSRVLTHPKSLMSGIGPGCDGRE